MNKYAVGAALAALSLAVPGAVSAQRAANAQIIVVDSGRIFRECTACVAAQTQIQGMVTSARSRAQQLGQPIQTEAQSIEQAAAALRNQTGAARTAAETQLQNRVQALRTRETTAQQELSRLEQNIQSTQANVVQQINARLRPIVTQVMNARNANLVLDTDATLEHSPALEVTNEVLAALNQQLPSVTVAPQAPAPAQPQQPQGR
jgi:Skp family chaperone for outer membrane proteins